MDYDGFERVYLPYLKENLDTKLYYHNYQHTLDVLSAAQKILNYEIVRGEDAELVQTAALLHDAGFMFADKDHEARSVVVAKEWLPGYDYSDEQIETVARLIMATVVGTTPTDLLEEIMCDSDMDYLGTDEFTDTANRLLRELREKGQKITAEEWDAIQIDFLIKHKYYTSFSREFRQAKKEDNLRKLQASYSVKS